MKGEKMTIFVAVLLPFLILLILLLIIFLLRCYSNKTSRDNIENSQTRIESHLSYNNSDSNNKRNHNHYVIRRGVLADPLFSWSDHPLLISEAVEHGWSRFAFASLSPSLSLINISWEIVSGSVDCMQKITLSSKSKKKIVGSRSKSKSKNKNNSLEFSYVRMELPLPGPVLGDSSFPPEAYFEITILSGEEQNGDDEIIGSKRNSMGENEQVKLISEIAMKTQFDADLVHANSINNDGNNKKIEEEDAGLISLGLAGGGFAPFKLPGSYPGSIGFYSNGSIHLDGIKLVFEAKEGDWGGKNKVIGCGFHPGRKRVLFTVDSKLVHVIHCKQDEFGSPLYPILASNVNVTVLVNLGQASFKYCPANMHRTPNPCFFCPSTPDSSSQSPTPDRMVDYEEDSGELFSMGRIDSKWLGSRNKNSCGSDENAAVDIDVNVGSEVDDLFEIVLDDGEKSR